MFNIAVVGIGYWGPNLLRNMKSISDVNIVSLCDLDLKRLKNIQQRMCPQAEIISDYKELAKQKDLDAVVIATPIKTHSELGKYFLSLKKHVFMEKPLAATVKECEELIALSQKNKLVLMVGHVFEYNKAVQRIKKYLDAGDLGKLLYIYSQRVNLGRIQSDINALWSFAPHDVSIVNYWLNLEPDCVAASGFSYLKKGIEDVVFMILGYPNGVKVHLHLSWLDPQKVRLMTLVGSKKMLIYDDVSLDNKIKIYDKGIHRLDDFLDGSESFAQFQFQIRTGDVLIPSLEFDEPLHTECQHFVDCVQRKETPATDGRAGLKVVKVLQAAEESLKKNGQLIRI